MAGEPKGSAITDDALVIFEVLSPSNTKADREWRQKVYASVPNCQHYVTVSLKSVDVALFDRSAGWTGPRIRALDKPLELAALGLSLPLAEIYRYTPLGRPAA
jgi:Uma2 family endonuclease